LSFSFRTNHETDQISLSQQQLILAKSFKVNIHFKLKKKEMKKLILAVSLIILSKDVLSQTTPDSVAYYSYMLVRSDKPFSSTDLKKPGDVFTRKSATCFFIRVKERLFLITALHVVNNEKVYSKTAQLIAKMLNNKSTWNSNFTPTSQRVNKDESFPYIEFRYYDDSTKSYEFFPINYQPKNIISPEYLAKHPDVEIIEIKGLSKHASIHSIEHILTAEHKNPDGNKDVIFYGFAEKPIDNQDELKPVMPFDDPSQYHGYVSTAANSAIDDFNALAGNRDVLYHYITPYTTGGASGAPVFFVKSDVNHKVSFEFAGIQSATSEFFNISFVTHEADVMKLLEKRINDNL
jgi:hypothetical protein